MKVRPMLSVLAVASISLSAACYEGGCDEHPRQGQVEREAPGASPKAVEGEQAQEEATRPDETMQAGVEGSELPDETGPVMQQCVTVVEDVMRCTTQQPFIDALVDEGAKEGSGLTQANLENMADYWREPGARRQTCQQLLLPEEQNPFRNLETLMALTEASEQQCVDFAEALVETGAVEALSTVDL